MIPPERYGSLGELLRDALVQYKSETALVELNRKREVASYTYLETKRAAERIALRLEELGVGAGDRVAIVMSNQPLWLMSAYAIFFRGAVLVPIDYKLSGPEQATLLRHCRPKVLVTEYAEWRDLEKERLDLHALLADMPAKATLSERAEHLRVDTSPLERAPAHVPRERSDQATLVYSSGTGGDPKGCVLTHDNYLEQYRTLLEVFPFEVGDRYFSVLPTNHAIDFMCGFVGPFACGATVVHQRSLRPEMLQWAMQNKRITHMAVVPLILEAFERRLRERLEERSEIEQHLFEGLRQLNAALTLRRPRQSLSRKLLKPVHDQLGPHLKQLFCGGAFVDPERAQLFYDLGIPVVIGYGLTEACTVLTVNDLKPFRPDSVGKALDGIEIEIRRPNADGVGEVWVKGRTVFAGYLDDPDQTGEVLRDGWLRTGDLGWLDPAQHLHLVGRSKNMIVTAGGKNIYPEDIESAFEGLECEELAVFATGFVWPGIALADEKLVAVLRPMSQSDDDGVLRELLRRNRKLPDFKRLQGVLTWDREFPRTASMKVKRSVLAEEIRNETDRDEVRPLLQ